MKLLGLVHAILNLVGLLLWVRWREDVLRSSRRSTGGTLLSTLKPAGGARYYRWTLPAILAGLVLIRGLVYWNVGSAVRWTPSIDLGAIVLCFRSDLLSRMLLYSVSSLAVLLVEFYFCLMLISAANRQVPDNEPLQNRVRAHLGWVDRWPGVIKLLLPFLATGLLWLALSPLLVRVGFLQAPKSFDDTLRQAAALGLASFLSWKYLIAAILLLHLVNSYVYLGQSPFWSFTNATGRNLLAPLSWIPFLRLGRLDFAPVLGAALVFLLGELAAHTLPELFQGRSPGLFKLLR